MQNVYCVSKSSYKLIYTQVMRRGRLFGLAYRAKYALNPGGASINGRSLMKSQLAMHVPQIISPT